MKDHLDLSSCRMGSWTATGDPEECSGHLWPVLKVGSSGVCLGQWWNDLLFFFLNSGKAHSMSSGRWWAISK